jgi:Predicted flavoproteins
MDIQANKYDVIVVGGGAAGMIAAGRAAECGKSVLLLEKNRRMGMKLKLTGNGRCNVTNMAPLNTFTEHYFDSAPFLHNAFSVFYNEELIALLRNLGVPTKVSGQGRVFPVSDCSGDIVHALRGYLEKSGVVALDSSAVERLLISGGCIQGVCCADKREFYASKVIIATGGKSYPETGSSGDGYAWAEQAGHRIIPLRPGLVGFEVRERWVKDLPGISLDNAEINFVRGTKKKRMRGEMIFTHYGVSGPLFLDAGAELSDGLALGNAVPVSLDIYPRAAAPEIARIFEEAARLTPHRRCKSVIAGLVPQKLALVCLGAARLPAEKQIHALIKMKKAV